MFRRNHSNRWHTEVPGARWFRADLHVHTLDDHPGGRLKQLVRGSPADPSTQTAYARAMLKIAAERGIEVLGLTPHAVRSGDTDNTCATWRIIEVWNEDVDDDGVPFRDKIYAVFPGFEPSISDGSRGVHLLFLFDPEIGRDCYLRAFHAVMGGVAPWSGNQLRNTGNDAATVFAALDRLQREEGDRFQYMCLAPHAFSNEKGLFDLRSQILQDFPSYRLSALELGDNQLPSDVVAKRPWLGPNMSELGHAFIHASDAYELGVGPLPAGLFEVGSRFTCLKLASPTIEACRQAFLASDSRVRIAFERGRAGELRVRDDVPAALPADRAWLRKLVISGGASFFGGLDGARPRTTSISFSPDLTCVVGSRMAGKSTLLDGLRLYFSRPLPTDERVKGDVEARGRQMVAGGATITSEVAGRTDPTVSATKQWPAVFFTQRELQDAVRNQAGLRRLLYRLSAEKSGDTAARERDLEALDDSIGREVVRASDLRQSLTTAEQELVRVTAARVALDRYRDSGAATLAPAQRDYSLFRSAAASVTQIRAEISRVADDVAGLVLPLPSTDAASSVVGNLAADLLAARAKIEAALKTALDEASAAQARIVDVAAQLGSLVQQRKTEVERVIVAAGGKSDELFQFERLTAVAGEFDERVTALEALKLDYQGCVNRIRELSIARQSLEASHRASLETVQTAIDARFDGKIRMQIDPERDTSGLDIWIKGLKDAAITRWWNDVSDDESQPAVSSQRILNALDTGTLETLGMSDRVRVRFTELIDETRRLQLMAIRCPDEYRLELRVGQGPSDYRAMNRLSGGQQVSLLLSLLLQSDDSRPLVIDQPEDELDSGYLFDTVLPALRRLKGRRQMIFATHNANIVVNGDADHVVYLTATSDRGDVAAQGAIEEPTVKQAILLAVDGGRDAFKLRYRKYGF